VVLHQNIYGSLGIKKGPDAPTLHMPCIFSVSAHY
jgi:hypothetical protein